MYFDSISDLIQMGHHGSYVWSAYIIGVALLVILAVLPVRKNKQFFEEQKRQRRRQQNNQIK